MQTKNSRRSKILLIIGVVILANIVFSRFFVRLDFTGDQRYTLSNATKNILKNLDETVTVKAYFTEDLPASLQHIRQDFEDMLIEYQNRSGGNVEYVFINPNESQETEVAASQEGIEAKMINVRERDQAKQLRAYLGAKIEYGDQSEVIPFIGQAEMMEFELSTKIKKIAGKNKRQIGLVTGHGEPSIGAVVQLKQQLDISYNVAPAQLSDSALVGKFESLVIIAPKDTFQQAELAALDRFLAAGKGIAVAMNRVEANLQNAQGTGVNIGLEMWLAEKGVNVNEDFVIDNECSNITVQEQQGFFKMNRQIKFPYLPLIKAFASHPITNGLEQVILPFASSITFDNSKTSAKFTPLARTSQRSGIEPPPLTFDIQKTQYDFITSGLVVAGALEGDIAGNGSTSKMVVYGDGDFIVNGEGQQQQPLSPDNVSLLANAIDWIVGDESGLNELRTKSITSRPIDVDELSESTIQLYKYGNFLLPILLIIGYGIFRSSMRNARRRRWERESYS